MKVVYRLDVLAALKQAGYSTYTLRDKRIFGEATIQRLRRNQSVSFDVIAKLCTLLNCNISDLLMCLDEPSVDSKFLESVNQRTNTDDSEDSESDVSASDICDIN